MDFDVKTDPNIDQVLAQLRVDQAQSQLPAQVTAAGLTVQKALTSPLMLVAINSPGGKLSQDFLTNYAIINLQDQIARVKGVSRVQTFGGQYALRVWVQPDKLAKLGVTATEVISAIQTQNNVNPAGQIGGEPIPQGQQFTYTVRTQGRLVKPEEFGEHHSSCQSRWLGASPERRCAHRTRAIRPTESQAATTRRLRASWRSISCPARMRWKLRLPSIKRMKELSATFPAEHHLQRPAGYHEGRHGRYSRDRVHAS